MAENYVYQHFQSNLKYYKISNKWPKYIGMTLKSLDTFSALVLQHFRNTIKGVLTSCELESLAERESSSDDSSVSSWVILLRIGMLLES